MKVEPYCLLTEARVCLCLMRMALKCMHTYTCTSAFVWLLLSSLLGIDEALECPS